MTSAREHPWRQRVDNRFSFMLNDKHDALLRRALLLIGLAGTALFAFLLALSYLNPIVLEKLARNAIAEEVQLRVSTRLDALSDRTLVRAAEQLLAKNRQEIAAKAVRAEQLSAAIGAVIDRMGDSACPCRRAVAEIIRDLPQSEIRQLDKVNARLTAMIESKYRDVAGALLQEVRVFSAANGAVFFLLGLIAWCWKRPALQLLAPAFVLVAAVGLTGSIYIFNQDWLQTILLGDYVGVWYVPYLLLALGFMSDVVFFRGTVTSKVINMVGASVPGC